MIKAVVFDMYETLITLFSGPTYRSEQMAEDAGISYEEFIAKWRITEDDRTLGRTPIEDVIRNIMEAHHCFTEEKLEKIMEKRISYKRDVFNHLHPEILQMLQALKEQGFKIGLISNCHSEEAMLIKESALYPYFDVACLSYDEGIKKPDLRIFERCLELLDLDASECLYIGDGGSHELEAAGKAGMHPAQAVWYLKPGSLQPTGRMPEYINVEKPMDILNLIEKQNAL